MPSDRERALMGVGFANKLFDVERDIKKLSPAQRLELRQERSRPIIDAYDLWRGVELEHAAVADGTSIRRAFQYSLNHWTALCRFLEDGRVPKVTIALRVPLDLHFGLREQLIDSFDL